MKIVVLGAGLVGGAIARDLAGHADFSVRAADGDPQALARLRAFGVEPECVEFMLAYPFERGVVHRHEREGAAAEPVR